MPFMKLGAKSGVECQMIVHVRLCTEVFAFALFFFDNQISAKNNLVYVLLYNVVHISL